jgi:hypothetical protein
VLLFWSSGQPKLAERQSQSATRQDEDRRYAKWCVYRRLDAERGDCPKTIAPACGHASELRDG